MPLPKRDYYFFDEVLDKLPLSVRDVQYYVCHGHLLLSVWVQEMDFMQEQNGTRVPFHHRGYLTLDPDIAFDLFHHGETMARQFYAFYPDARLYLPDNHPSIHLTEKCLMVNALDFEAFTSVYDVPILDQKKSVGRPRLVDAFVSEHEKRSKEGRAKKSLSAESADLYEWGCRTFSGQSVPSTNSIRNALMMTRKASA